MRYRQNLRYRRDKDIQGPSAVSGFRCWLTQREILPFWREPFDPHSKYIRGESQYAREYRCPLSLLERIYIERTFGGLMHQGKIDRLPTGRDLTRSIWNALFTRFKIKPSLSLLVFIFLFFPTSIFSSLSVSELTSLKTLYTHTYIRNRERVHQFRAV